MNLPLADPQFWLVTLGAAVALALVVRRLRRSGAAAGPACDRCPKSPDAKRRVGGLVAFALLLSQSAGAAAVERQVAAMGTTLRLEVEVAGDRAVALALAERMIGAVAATEAGLSTWRDDSDLSRLNRTPVGDWVDAANLGALVDAGRCWEETGGAFHPAMGRLVAAWDLRGAGRIPGAAEIAAARRGLDALGFEFAGRPQRVRRTADLVFEEGAFGKGAGLDRALDVARREPAAGFVRLDFGGQVAWTHATRPVVVDLADPRDRARPVLELSLDGRSGSLSTSGNGGGRRDVDGLPIGHLLDPRTGRPAAEFGAVAVVAADALRADCTSTALFVMGPVAGARWLAGRDVAAAFLVVDGERLRARLTPELARRARPLVAELEIETLERGEAKQPS